MRSTQTSWILLTLSLAVVGSSCAQTERASETATDPEALLPNGRLSAEGILVGGQPSEEQLAAARDAGYKTVINLRTEGESGGLDPSVVESLGLNYVAIPIAGAEGLNEDSAVLFSEALEKAEKPAVVHCGSGNRVGALFALEAYYVDDMSAEESLAIGLDAGLTSLEPAVRKTLGLPES